MKLIIVRGFVCTVSSVCLGGEVVGCTVNTVFVCLFLLFLNSL